MATKLSDRWNIHHYHLRNDVWRCTEAGFTVRQPPLLYLSLSPLLRTSGEISSRF